MKKLLLVLAIGAFAACNNASQEAAPAVDSAATPAVTVDSAAAAAPADSSAAAAPAVDTTKK